MARGREPDGALLRESWVKKPDHFPFSICHFSFAIGEPVLDRFYGLLLNPTKMENGKWKMENGK
jgi:hypothetical protein